MIHSLFGCVKKLNDYCESLTCGQDPAAWSALQARGARRVWFMRWSTRFLVVWKNQMIIANHWASLKIRPPDPRFGHGALDAYDSCYGVIWRVMEGWPGDSRSTFHNIYYFPPFPLSRGLLLRTVFRRDLLQLDRSARARLLPRGHLRRRGAVGSTPHGAVTDSCGQKGMGFVTKWPTVDLPAARLAVPVTEAASVRPVVTWRDPGHLTKFYAC